MFPYFNAHRRACREKQQERKDSIAALPAEYRAPLTAQDVDILRQPASAIVSRVQSGALSPKEVLVAYGKKALLAHADTNCLTEIIIPKAELWAQEPKAKQGPLAGMPISLKDTTGVAGFDACIGYSKWVHKPFSKDAPIVSLLRDAGALPFVKTNIPITLLSFESNSDVFGRTTNPHSKGFSPGGSSGGEGALLALGGSRLGLGTDVAGSVRVPAHYSGVYTIKASSGRFPKVGNASGMVGQEGIPAVYSPMTRTLEDLETFWKAVVSMKPWEYDPSCLPIPWREIDLPGKKTLKWGVIWDDGIVTPSPACKRALQEVVSALEADGHEVIDIDPPSPLRALEIGSQLLANACLTASSYLQPNEANDPGVALGTRALRIPFARSLARLHALSYRIPLLRFHPFQPADPLYASLVEGWHVHSGQEHSTAVGARDAYRREWFDFWKAQDLDFVLTVPNALPAVRHGGNKEGWKACGYTFLFNVLDYAAGVLPVTHVDRALDAIASTSKPSSYRNAVEAGVYRGPRAYDADAMHGLPVGVQIVGQRLEEEKVLAGMQIIEGLLKKAGKGYEGLPVNVDA